MKKVAYCLPLVLLLATIVTAQESVKNETLGQFRAKYLGKRVVLHARIVDVYSPSFRAELKDKLDPPFLGGWERAKLVGDRYETDMSMRGKYNIPSNYASQEPTIIAIQLAASGGGQTQPSTNALGERVRDNDIENPYVDVVVRFDDGQVAKLTSYVSLFESEHSKEFGLASVRDRHAAEFEEALPRIVGRNLYAIAKSKVLSVDSSIEDLMDYVSTKALGDVPYLEPLRVADARYNGTTDHVILKLQLPDGRFGLAATQYDDQGGDDMLSRVSGKFLTAIPTGLTPREVTAIQGHKIFRGMSRYALNYSWGTPDKENDWGKGGRQLVFGDNQFVYLDSQNVVTDFQSLNQ